MGAEYLVWRHCSQDVLPGHDRLNPVMTGETMFAFARCLIYTPTGTHPAMTEKKRSVFQPE
jgi:hypothetical protein